MSLYPLSPQLCRMVALSISRRLTGCPPPPGFRLSFSPRKLSYQLEQYHCSLLTLGLWVIFSTPVELSARTVSLFSSRTSLCHFVHVSWTISENSITVPFSHQSVSHFLHVSWAICENSFTVPILHQSVCHFLHVCWTISDNSITVPVSHQSVHHFLHVSWAISIITVPTSLPSNEDFTTLPPCLLPNSPYDQAGSWGKIEMTMSHPPHPLPTILNYFYQSHNS